MINTERLFGLNSTKEQNCTNCKHSYLSSVGTVYITKEGEQGTKFPYNCNIRRKEVTENDKCWKYIKRGSILDRLGDHLSKHWKFWITTLIIVILGLLNLFYKG